MSRRRTLPEAAYDFWATDGRDGERGVVRDTLLAARADVRKWRRTLVPWSRCVIHVEWEVSEMKVLRLLGVSK